LLTQRGREVIADVERTARLDKDETPIDGDLAVDARDVLE
jgi:hypothetical protein